MAEKLIKQLRDFPSVEELLQCDDLASAVSLIPRPVAAEIVKREIASLKADFKKQSGQLTLKAVTKKLVAAMTLFKRTEIAKVINATGIIVHTNLGRAPLSDDLFEAVKESVVGFGNIEFDLSTGQRGKRGMACERYLAVLSGAGGAAVVNNCAAALFVILNTLANRRKVIISRGELVQIGGGFRIPDILKRSGSILAEVGTSNITTRADYENAVDDKAALLLKVHQSNFVQRGFTDQVDIKDLVAIGAKFNMPVVNDLGSGVFVSTGDILGYSEPTVQQSVRDGAALTCFSGDKMLGGVQAGLIVGSAEMVNKLKKNPLFRAVRVDKVVFAMLEKLLTYYLDGQWASRIKLWSMLSISESELYKRAKRMLAGLGNPSGLSVEATRAFIGGGALPEASIPSVGIVFSTDYKATDLLRRFREMSTPVIGRIENERFILDIKAIDESDIPYLEQAIKKVIQ